MINITYKKSRISLHKKSSDYLDSKKNTSKNMANNIGNCHVENTSLYSFDFTINVMIKMKKLIIITINIKNLKMDFKKIAFIYIMNDIFYFSIFFLPFTHNSLFDCMKNLRNKLVCQTYILLVYRYLINYFATVA